MALINKIREKTGLAVGVIAFGLILFLVGGDLLGPNSMLLGKNSTTVGEIAGEEIDYQDYLQRVEEYSAVWAQRYGNTPSSEQLVTIREQVWNDLIREIAYNKQFETLGLSISDKEIEDMVKGNNISPIITQSFTNPQTGEFNKEDVIAFLRSYNDRDPQQQAQWNQLQAQLGPNRLETKYQSLLLNTNFVTSAEGKQQYMATSGSRSVTYMYIPYFSIPDSTIEVSDSELRAYISENSEDYKADETKDIAYVTFKVIPSAEDTAYIKEEIDALKLDLEKTENDSLFAYRNSEAFTPFKSYRMDELPTELQESESLEVGAIVGPVQVGSKFVLYKVAEVGERDKYSARASHILFKADGDTPEAKADAKAEARKILREIKNGASFESMARIHGTDGTAQRGGDLGWFAEGDMVGPFNDAVMNASRTGLLNDVVETDFGYHIIDVTETKTNDYYKVAQIEKEVFASDETINEFYREADIFASSATSYDEFKANAEKEGLTIETRKRVGRNDRSLNRLNNARQVVFWAFNEASVGDVSEVYDLESQYVVAVVTGGQEEGTASLESVRNEVERKVINKKKAEKIKSQLSGKEGSLEELAETYGDEAQIHSMPGLTLSANSLSNVGSAPAAIGAAFALEEGERTGTLESDNGVIVLRVDAITPANELDDYTASKDQVAQRRQVRIRQNMAEAIKEFAAIEDNRYKFF